MMKGVQANGQIDEEDLDDMVYVAQLLILL